MVEFREEVTVVITERISKRAILIYLADLPRFLSVVRIVHAQSQASEQLKLFFVRSLQLKGSGVATLRRQSVVKTLVSVRSYQNVKMVRPSVLAMRTDLAVALKVLLVESRIHLVILFAKESVARERLSVENCVVRLLITV